MPQSHSAVFLHLIFSTKHRQPFMRDPKLRTTVHETLAAASRKLDCPPVTVGGVEDHVHILARLGRSISIGEWVKEIKRSSTLNFKKAKAVPRNFHWQSGYGVFSIGQSGLQRTVDYIARQEERHRRISFQDELRAFFRKYGIEFDERFVWD